MTSGVIGTLTGTRVLRKEDQRILTGRGRYVDDIRPAGLLHAVFVRSHVAHGVITRVDTADAEAMPGVRLVLTGAQMSEHTNALDFGVPGLADLITPVYTALSVDKVRFMGDPVALVVAESPALAEDAAAAVVLEVQQLPAIMRAPTRDQLVHSDVPDNIMFKRHTSQGDVDAAFATADHEVSITVPQHRWAPVPMETRGGIATYDAGSGLLTYEASCQSPHLLRLIVGGAVQQPQHLMRVLGPDVGGGFGLKWAPCREDVALCAAAKLLGTAVKWIEDRNENLIAGGHARDDTVTLTAAVRRDGTLLALRGDILLDQGAYPMMPSASTTTAIMRCMLPGPYRVPAFECTERVVFTNKAPYLSLRGPWAVETLVRERLLDKIARELGITPIAVREKNLLPLAEQPYDTAAGFPIDGVTSHETFRRALELVDQSDVQRELARARGEGRVVGFGIATFMEPAPGTPEMWSVIGFPFPGERARVKVEPDGHVSVFTQQMPNGQGHETTLAQLAADELGVRFEDVRVVFGDTQTTPFGMIGTGGSRAATFATGTVRLSAREVRSRILDAASVLLEADVKDLVIQDGVVSVVGVPGSQIPMGQVAAVCYMAPALLPPGMNPDLEAACDYDGEGGGFAQATHCCWVEIDPDTGLVCVQRFLAVDDCGKMINPAVVEGQIRGAITMGIGGMLLEQIAYDDEGNCVTGTFLDYLMPTATDVPDFELEHIEFESERLVGSRGVGEGGTILAPAALLNAIDDAVVAAGGVPASATPITPSRVLEMLGRLPGPAAGAA
jgi:aerobic carbon-monoxide dehydrogenase large subunit